MTEMIARLAPGASVQQARTEVAATYARMQRDHKDAYDTGSHFRVAVIPFKEALGERASLTLWLLMGAAAFVLIISAANVVNLTLMRGVRREADLEHVVGLRLADDEPVSLVLDDGRRRHPVERLEAAGVVVHEDGSVRLEDEKPDRLRKNGAQAAGITDLTAGDEQAHTGNLLSVPDRSRSTAAGPAGWVARLTTNCRECGRRRRLQTG